MPDPHDPQFGSLPDALIDRLREMDGPRPFVPPEMDQAVLDQARAHFAGRVDAVVAPRRPSRWLTLGLPLAAAAMIVVSLLAVQTSRMLTDLKEGISQTPLALAPGGQAELAWDIDRSGQLDILDVYLLAKRREAGDENITPAILDSLCDRIVNLDRITAFADPSARPHFRGERAGVLAASNQHGGPNG